MGNKGFKSVLDNPVLGFTTLPRLPVKYSDNRICNNQVTFAVRAVVAASLQPHRCRSVAVVSRRSRLRMCVKTRVSGGMVAAATPQRIGNAGFCRGYTCAITQ
jgi:hypothetical protein